MFNNFFFRLSIHASAVKIKTDKVEQWRKMAIFLLPVFSASRVQHISHICILNLH